MPIGAWAHAQYWRFSADLPPVVPSTGLGQYPQWQTTVILGSLLGGVQAWYEQVIAAWRLSRRLRQLQDERQQIVMVVLELLEHEAYGIARTTVKQTATTLGFNKPTAWQSLGHVLKARPDWTENMYRHLNAMWLLDAAIGEKTLSNPQKNVLIELAYHGYAVSPKRAEAWRSPTPTSA